MSTGESRSTNIIKEKIRMDDIIIKYIEKPELKEPVFIEGLPGVGNVGKLAAEHMIEQLDATLFAEIYSIYLPPQVLVEDDGIARLVNNKLYYKKDAGTEGRDLIILTGDYQGMTPQGQYQMTDKLLSIVKDMGASIIVSLGGYGQGQMVDKPRVLGAATNEKIVEMAKEHGTVFDEDHPSAGIVGASGLLLGLGHSVYELDGICLMGETSGYFVDPAAAREVLEILTSYIGIEDMSYDELDDKAEEVEALTNKVLELEGSGMGKDAKREDLNYIG